MSGPRQRGGGRAIRRARTKADLERVYRMLVAAAEANAVCPAGTEIAAALGWASKSCASRAVTLLEADGRITVEHPDRTSRIVTIVATCKTTARPAPVRRGAAKKPRGGFATGKKPRRGFAARRASERGNLALRLTKIHQAQATGLRKTWRAAGIEPPLLGMRPGFSGGGAGGGAGGAARTCQWIEGEPTADDACKCAAPTVSMPDGRRSSWCAVHRPICYRRAGDAAYGGHPVTPVGRRNP